MTIRTDRPKIFLTPSIVAILKTRVAKPTSRMSNLISLCDRSTEPTWDIGIINHCLAYVVTGNPKYSANAYNLMSQSMASGIGQVTGDSGYQARNLFPAASVVLDWCYPALTAAQRTALVASIEMCADWIYPRTNPSRVGQWGVEQYGNNYHAGFQYTWTAGLALYGDSAKAQGYIDEGLRRWNSDVLPYLNTTAAGGALLEGTSYSVDYLGMTMLQLLAHSTATDTDLLTPQLATGWCSDAIRWLAHMTAPTMDRLAPIGDQTKNSGGALQDAARLPMLIAASKGNLDAKAWLDNTIPPISQQRLNAWIETLLYPETL